MKVPAVTEVARKDRSPFKVLISTMLSLRTRDETTYEASKRLFRLASSPEEMLTLDVDTIEGAIYPVGFYRNKARAILEVCTELVDKYASRVPDEIDTLTTLKGVGRKTANLVVTLGFGKPGICVDTHVHRISNRLGFVSTKTPLNTEMALRKKLPAEYWIVYNDLLVTYGQNICSPLSPRCSTCRLSSYCDRVGVTRSR